MENKTCKFPNIPDIDGHGTDTFCNQTASKEVTFEVESRGFLNVPACSYHHEMYEILFHPLQLAKWIDTGRIAGTWSEL